MRTGSFSIAAFTAVSLAALQIADSRLRVVTGRCHRTDGSRVCLHFRGTRHFDRPRLLGLI